MRGDAEFAAGPWTVRFSLLRRRERASTPTTDREVRGVRFVKGCKAGVFGVQGVLLCEAGGVLPSWRLEPRAGATTTSGRMAACFLPNTAAAVRGSVLA
eukprot:966171-Prorocentrum_minimum.AAC.1